MIHSYSHRQCLLDILLRSDFVDVGGEGDASEEDHVVDAKEDVKDGTLLDEPVPEKNQNQADVTQTEHPSFSKPVYHAAHQRTGEKDKRLVDHRQHHGATHRHPVHLDQHEESKGDKHLLAAPLEELEGVEDAVTPFENHPFGQHRRLPPFGHGDGDPSPDSRHSGHYEQPLVAYQREQEHAQPNGQ